MRALPVSLVLVTLALGGCLARPSAPENLCGAGQQALAGSAEFRRRTGAAFDLDGDGFDDLMLPVVEDTTSSVLVYFGSRDGINVNCFDAQLTPPSGLGVAAVTAVTFGTEPNRRRVMLVLDGVTNDASQTTSRLSAYSVTGGARGFDDPFEILGTIAPGTGGTDVANYASKSVAFITPAPQPDQTRRIYFGLADSLWTATLTADGTLPGPGAAAITPSIKNVPLYELAPIAFNVTLDSGAVGDEFLVATSDDFMSGTLALNGPASPETLNLTALDAASPGELPTALLDASRSLREESPWMAVRSVARTEQRTTFAVATARTSFRYVELAGTTSKDSLISDVAVVRRGGGSELLALAVLSGPRYTNDDHLLDIFVQQAGQAIRSVIEGAGAVPVVLGVGDAEVEVSVPSFYDEPAGFQGYPFLVTGTFGATQQVLAIAPRAVADRPRSVCVSITAQMVTGACAP